MKKICFVLDQFLYGGIERVLINYLLNFDYEKYEVDVIILSNYEKFIEKIPPQCNIIIVEYDRYHVPLSRASLMNKYTGGAVLYYGTYWLKRIVFDSFFSIKYRKLKQKKYDHVIAFSSHFNDLYFSLNFLKGVHKAAWVHGILYQYLLLSPAFEKLYSKFDNLILINHLDQNDIFYCKSYLKYKMNKLYNPIISEKSKDTNKIENIKKRCGKFILSVARLESPKDFETLILSFHQYITTSKSLINLVIVGDGPDKEKLMNLAKGLGILDRVFFEGSQSDVAAYYQSCYFFVLSSKVEGLGNVIVEAMIHKKGVIATDAPYGPRDILKNNDYGVLVPVADVSKLKDAIKRFDTDKKILEEYEKKGYERSKDFNYKNILNEFYIILKGNE